MSKYKLIGILGATTILSAILLSGYNSPQGVESYQWTPSPYESVDEHMAIVKPIISENESRIETNRKFIHSSSLLVEKLKLEILELKQENYKMQNSIDITYKSLNGEVVEEKTVVLDDILEVPVVETRFIPGGKAIPSGITGNTKAKRFHNFVAHFARGFDSSVFVQARNRYGVKEEVLACIAWADSDMGNANKSSNNIMNIGNNDRGDTRSFDSVLGSVMSAAYSMSKGKYLARNSKIGELSQGGRTHLGLPGCAEQGQYCYATSPVNRRRNVNNCLTFIEGERKDWDNLPFKN